jgi:hypothetical protein
MKYKGNGRFDHHEKTRWIMRHGNGDEFTTDGYYHYDEVCAWECSVPVKPIPNATGTSKSELKRLAIQRGVR